MDRERIRKGAQFILVGIAVVATGAAAYRFMATRDPAGAEAGERVVVNPAAGPVGMRPFVEIQGYPDGQEIGVYLCGPQNETGPVSDCVELASAPSGTRVPSVPIPSTLPDGADLEPATYHVRAGPDADGGYPVQGEFRVVVFAIGRPPDTRSFAAVDPQALTLDRPREIARGAPCRTRFLPDGRLAIGATIFDPRTGVPIELEIEGAELAWSPDRDRLAIVTADRKEIRLAEPDGSDPQAVVREARGILSSVTWSPDGDRFAYIARSEPGVPGGPGPPAVFVFNLVDGAGSRLGSGETVAWAPTPDRLAVETPGGVIELSDLAGGRTRLTEGRRPSWSPDGSLVAFIRPQDADIGEGWVTRVDTDASARIVEGGICGLAFSSDGDRMAVVAKEDNATTLFLRAVKVDG